jgi:hypothetical protein
MKVPIFNLSDASKGMVRLYDDLIEWRHRRIRGSLEPGRSNFTTTAASLECSVSPGWLQLHVPHQFKLADSVLDCFTWFSGAQLFSSTPT